ncbi:MAG TPA: tetratricopeptide repeat protein [Myxococcaceae bacterium]|nr:tetratricopeptide repeat protein [Myxococcaceae bacterium]
MTPYRPPRCTRHPSSPAGWHCDACGNALCPECMETRRMQTVDLRSCRACGGQAQPLLVHRARLTPLSTRLHEAWRHPFSTSGLALALPLGALLALFDFFTDSILLLLRGIPLLLGAGIFWSAFFTVVRASAQGEREIPAADYSEFFAHWVAPALRGLLATSVAWAPTLLYLLLSAGWDAVHRLDVLLEDPMFHMRGQVELPLDAILGDPIVWLLGLAGFLYLPMALMLAAVGGELRSLFSPLKAVRGILRLGKDYGHALGALLLTVVAVSLIRALVSRVGVVDFFTVSRWLGQVAECLVFFGLAHVLGLILHLRGDVLGYGPESDYLVPMLEAPRTTLRTREMDLTARGQAAQEAMALLAPPSEEAPTTRLQALAAAVEARDVAQALALYTSLRGLPRKTIAPALHLFVGQAAATGGDYPLAVEALEAAADVAPEDPLAPRALVLLARVLGERMEDPSRARSVYRYIVERYPETDASRFAQSRLSTTS